ncbi:MAG: MOSC domain-containing protein [Xanthomonadales bacterium]|nr:MOSC domain-containing protein [Xanthomonadales bacterium]
MTEGVKVATVAVIWRFPVKSMLGETLSAAEIGPQGIPGDRGWAVVDRSSGKLVSAKDFRRYPNMFALRGKVVESGQAARDSVSIELPDGTEVAAGTADCDRLLSEHLGQDVKLVRANAQSSENVEHFHDDSPVSVLTNATLDQMNALQPGSRFDARRFRMNLILDSDARGFPENDWVGRRLLIGDGIVLRITKPDARCAMTTLAQEDLPEDREILKGLARHNRLSVGDHRRYPCAGVYASVASGGRVEVGDVVRLE